MFKSIKSKWISTIWLMAFIPILILGYLSYQSAYDAIYALTVNDLKYITQIKATELDNAILRSAEQTQIQAIVDELQMEYYEPQGMSGYAYLLDPQGVVLVHPDPQTQGTSLAEHDFIQTILDQKNGYIEYDWKGETKVVSFNSLSNGNILAIGSYLEDLMIPVLKIKQSLLIIGAVASLLAIGIGLIIVRKITLPIFEMVHAMKRAEQGDLRVQVEPRSKDEMGTLALMFNEMMSHFRNMVTQVHVMAQQVAASSEELSVSSNEGAKATEQIASASQEIAEGSEKQIISMNSAKQLVYQMNQKVKNIAKNVNKVNQDSEYAAQYAHQGERNLGQVVDQMTIISNQVQITEQVIRQLGDQSSEISGIVKTIQDISQQTNLLALNAAIEAARAGEQGRGFSIVASEVRKLAEQSATSAEEIKRLITFINDEIRQATISMSENTKVVMEGREVVEKTTEAFGHILQAIDKVKDQIEEVTVHSNDIDQGSESVVAAVEAVAYLAEISSADTQQVAAASEEQTATMQDVHLSSEMLAKVAVQLQEQVNRFKI